MKKQQRKIDEKLYQQFTKVVKEYCHETLMGFNFKVDELWFRIAYQKYFDKFGEKGIKGLLGFTQSSLGGKSGSLIKATERESWICGNIGHDFFGVIYGDKTPRTLDYDKYYKPE